MQLKKFGQVRTTTLKVVDIMTCLATLPTCAYVICNNDGLLAVYFTHRGRLACWNLANRVRMLDLLLAGTLTK